jgi:phage-related minor tail protein
MTEQEYIRMKNLLNTVIEQQAVLAEEQAKAELRANERNAKTDERIARNAEAIAALLTLAEIHEEEITRASKETAAQFKETHERINALVDVVERYIGKG